jgi:hypothetical protein
MQKFIKPFQWFGLLLFISTCAENTSSPLQNDDDNGNTPVTSVYVRDIQPIFNSNCASSGCHASSSASSGIKLSSYTDVMASTGTKLGKLVIVNDATNSPLVKVIEGTASSVSRMPLGGSSLSASDITKIKNWINDGAKN